MATALWRGTLAPTTRHDDHRQEREHLRDSYLSLRGNATHLLAEAARSTSNFTVHDITHVDALWETASLVCGDGTSLNPAEAYVLGCAFVLHDAAMGLAAYPEGLPATLGEQRWRDLLAVAYYESRDCWPQPDELEQPPTDILESCRIAAIRDTHAQQAERLVEQPWVTTSGNQFHLIQDVQLREAYGPLIGELAASHWRDTDELTGRFKRAKGSLTWQPAEWIIEPLKLACILRLADATQIDSRRAPTFLFALRDPRGESRRHWRFQEHLSRPHLSGDRITYTSLRPFGREDAAAWWLALDYLRAVDRELKSVDSLLHDLGRTRLAARAVAGVDSPERFAELLPAQGWRPVDAAVRISDVPGLVGTLGGEQLYGTEPEVAVRELIQNGHDAVLARGVVDPDFTDGHVDISLAERDGTWILEVRDNGIGMDEDLLVHGLLDFGRSGWRTSQMRTKFPGLASGGFAPRGRFGIGFYAVFMLGNEVELITRRYDGAQSDARRLSFTGLSKRPLLTALAPHERAAHGTTVRIKLTTNPYDSTGVLRNTGNDRVSELVQRLALETAVPLHSHGPRADRMHVLSPFTLAQGSAEEVFDRLYPPRSGGWQANLEKQRLLQREAFSRRASELFDSTNRRIGLAALGEDLRLSETLGRGMVTVNGFLADEVVDFTGYIEGTPNRASRDKVNLAPDPGEVRRWLKAQEQRLRDLGLFTDSIQSEHSYVLHSAFGALAPDHYVGITRQGSLRFGETEAWARQRDEIFLARGLPLIFSSRPPRVTHQPTGAEPTLSENCFVSCAVVYGDLLYDMFPNSANRDVDFAFARFHEELTWERLWWQLSGSIEGSFLKSVCRAWSCSVGDILAPPAQRQWSDTLDLEDNSLTPLFGYRLNRP